jgi:hypothetical protein
MDYAGDPIRETIDRPVTLFMSAALISPSAKACRLRGKRSVSGPA